MSSRWGCSRLPVNGMIMCFIVWEITQSPDARVEGTPCNRSPRRHCHHHHHGRPLLPHSLMISCTRRGPPRSCHHRLRRPSPPLCTERPPCPPNLFRFPATAAVPPPLLPMAWIPADPAPSATGAATLAPIFVERRAPCSPLQAKRMSGKRTYDGGKVIVYTRSRSSLFSFFPRRLISGFVT